MNSDLTECQAFLNQIRKVARDYGYHVISDLIKFHFNSKYGELAEGSLYLTENLINLHKSNFKKENCIAKDNCHLDTCLKEKQEHCPILRHLLEKNSKSKNFYCPACGQSRSGNSVDVKDFEVDSKNHKKILSKSYVYRCLLTHKAILIQISD